MRTGINPRYVSKAEATIGVFCLALGLVAPVLGGILAGIEWLMGLGLHPFLHVIVTGLFVVGIPLILIAGFCLDGAESAKKRAMSKS